MKTHKYDNPAASVAVVFAGGGCRCLWQVGFWEVAAPALDLRPRSVAAVSAGAAMACLSFGGDIARSLASFKRRAAENRRNWYPGNLLRRAEVFPHERIYRQTLLENINDAGFDRLRTGPEIRILLARPPRWLGSRSALLAAFAAYQIEHIRTTRVHPIYARSIGFQPEVVSVRDCQTPDELADLILHSSCTPPFTPAYRRDGRPVLDGGLVDGTPVEALRDGETPALVLLTKPFAEAAMPKIAGRIYVRPSRELPIHKWDYTSPDGVQAAYDLGRRDAESFVRHWR